MTRVGVVPKASNSGAPLLPLGLKSQDELAVVTPRRECVQRITYQELGPSVRDRVDPQWPLREGVEGTNMRAHFPPSDLLLGPQEPGQWETRGHEDSLMWPLASGAESRGEKGLFFLLKCVSQNRTHSSGITPLPYYKSGRLAPKKLGETS